MNRRRAALALLLAFVLSVGTAVVVSGSQPGLPQGIAPTVIDVVGYLFALVAAVLLLVRGDGGGGERSAPAQLAHAPTKCDGDVLGARASRFS